MNTKIESDLCNKGYYLVKWGFEIDTVRIRRREKGLVKHNYGWISEKEWLDRKPIKIEKPTLWDRITNFI